MNPPAPAAAPAPGKCGLRWEMWATVVLCAAILTWFFGMEPLFGPGRAYSALGWLLSTWSEWGDFEHGRLFPFLIGGLLLYRRKDLRAAAGPGSSWGLLVVLLGALCFAVAYRTLQPRIAVGGLPFLVWGSAWYLWGWRVAKILSFPLFFFWMAIPVPSLQQATTQLQLLATAMAHHGAGWCGVETYTQGTDILPVKGNWPPLSIAGGCSGIRSLMALLMISAVWAYIAKIALWKKVLLFFSAVPLAIVGNALRVTSIFVIAEYGDAKWARETWHDWAGLLLFYPFSLALLLCFHALLEGGLPWKHPHRKQLRRVVANPSDPANPLSPAA